MSAPARDRRITVIQDLDGANVGYGAFWGEVQSNVHKALGCLGVVTDGSIRDIPMWAPEFQALAGSIGPSHAHVHLQDFDETVSVAGMIVRPGDLIHADCHGAIVIPVEAAEKIPAACDLLARREEVILTIARVEGFHHREAESRDGEVCGDSLSGAASRLSSPGLTRRSRLGTQCPTYRDGRDKPGHDSKGA